MLLAELTPPADAKPGPVAIRGDADWLVCKDICIPEKATLTLAFAVADGEPGADAGQCLALREGARAPSRRARRLDVGIHRLPAASSRCACCRPRASVAPAKVAYFPHRENFIDHPAPQALVRDGNGFRLDVKLVEPVPAGVTDAAGVLVAESSWPGFAGPQGRGARDPGRGRPARDRRAHRRAGRRSGRQPRPRARLRACRRPAAEPHAVRLPGARHQGDGLRAPRPRRRARAVAAGRGLLGRRPRLLPRPRGAAPRAARRRHGARLGLPAAVARVRDGCSPPSSS